MTPSLRCWAEVNLDALRGNLSWIRHRAGPAVKVITVVKADAYGHGLQHIAALLMQAGTDMFGVANLGEARMIHRVGRGWPVLLLGACLPDEIEAAVRDGVRPTISALAEARAFSASAQRQHRRVSVHLKVDTGLGRLGVAPEAAPALARHIAALPGLELEGVFTHFASAEHDAAFTRRQLGRFHTVLAALEQAGLRPPLVHVANSAALLHEPDAMFTVVRPGLLVYGVLPMGRRAPHAELRARLRPALAFKARIGLVKDIGRGATLTYGRAFVASRPMRVATLTVGFGDGLPRAGSHRAQVLIRGRRCPVLGRVMMDQTLVDVSRAGSVKPGDEVVLIGRQGRQEITANDLAAWCDTIPWEILTGITARVPRVFRGGQAA